MKHEILRKTIFYRVLAFTIGLLVPILTVGSITLGLISGFTSEIVSLITYYIFEYCWRKYVERIKLTAGQKLFVANDKHGWYNVLEVQDDNKILIEVV